MHCNFHDPADVPPECEGVTDHGHVKELEDTLITTSETTTAKTPPETLPATGVGAPSLLISAVVFVTLGVRMIRGETHG